MPKTRDLTLKQKKFIKRYLETGNAAQAIIDSYDVVNRDTAAEMGSQNLRKLKDVVQSIMVQRGLDLDKMVEVVYGATEATKWNDFTGEREPDHMVRLKAIDVASKWLGLEEKAQINILGKGDMSIEFIGNDGESSTTQNTA